MQIADIEKYLVDDIKPSPNNDVRPLVESTVVPQQGGFFAALRNMFTYVDYFGYLMAGNSSSKNAVEFIRKYMGKVDPRYEKVGGLLYYMYRHGTVHEYEPKLIVLSDGTKVGWLLVKDAERSKNQIHLTKVRYDGVITVRIHLQVLYSDLLKALDLYLADLRAKPQLQQNFSKVRAAIETGETESRVMAPGKGKSYVTPADWAFVRTP